MLSIEQLEQARARLRTRLIFPQPAEDNYRASQRRRHHLPRSLFFVVVILAFALAPFCNQILMHPSPDVLGLVLGIELGWALPGALASLTALLLRWPNSVSRAIQTYGVLSLWGAVLCLNLLALLGQLQYPPGIFGAAVISAGLFCGYRTRRFAAGATTAMALYVAMTLYLSADLTASLHRLYESLFFWIIAVAGAVSSDQLSRQLWLRHQEVKALARIDSLTRIPNRAHFTTQLELMVGNAAREQQPVALAFLDLDHFKSINDRFGHQVGDEMLRSAARVISAATAKRKLDIVARIGGEEFAIAWYAPKPEALPNILEELLAAIREVRHDCPSTGQTHQLTVSIGAICRVPPVGTPIDNLLGEADRLLYRAKHGGRNQAVLEVLENPSGAIRALAV